MTIIGSSEDAIHFLRNLDEKKLVDLYADMRTLEGYTEIKIMDGPGDGQRDIHSIDGNGEKHLTQSKFHNDPLKAVSSKELGEVVLGMVKLGYNKGCFITNAKISPQAKRECLDNYPGYSIEFIEGREIAKRVFDNLIMRAIWCDGESIERVSYALTLPIVARDSETDRPLRLLPKTHERWEGNLIKAGRSEVNVNFQRSTVSTSLFDPYRPPYTRTISEFGSSISNTIEVVLTGIIHLEDVNNILYKVVMEAFSRIDDFYNGSKKHVAVRGGTSYLTPLQGDSSGARIELKELNPTTFVKHGNETEYEIDWVCPGPESNWYPPTRIGGSNSSWVRWYNPKIDTCLNLSIISPPSASDRWQVEERYDYVRKWWSQSLFFLLPRTIQKSWVELNLPEPTLAHYWDDKNLLCGWLHPSLRTPVRTMLFEDDEYPQEKPKGLFPPFFNSDGVSKEMNELGNLLEDLEGIRVMPDKARHMIAVVDKDPFPTTEIMLYAPSDLIIDSDTIIPSPIDLRARQIQFTICWILGESLSNEHQIYELDPHKFLDEILSDDTLPFNISAQIDNNMTLKQNSYLLVHFEYKNPIDTEKTDNLLKELENRIILIIPRIEECLALCFRDFRQATKKYWFDEIFMDFVQVKED